MSELVHLQEQFQKFLLSQESTAHDSIMPTGLVSVTTRLGIYRDAYALRLMESLSVNFPLLYAYLGTEEAEQLFMAYIAAHPSTYRSIRWFGDSLAEFTTQYYKKNPHLAELADFEWRMTLAFDAADAPVVGVDEMASLPAQAWADLQFELHPSIQRVHYFWNAVPIWQALAYEQELPALYLNEEANSWVLWRTPEYQLQFYSLSQEESWALDALSQGISFALLCEGFCQWFEPEEVGMRAASYLKGWIQKGMVSKLLIID